MYCTLKKKKETSANQYSKRTAKLYVYSSSEPCKAVRKMNTLLKFIVKRLSLAKLSLKA